MSLAPFMPSAPVPAIAPRPDGTPFLWSVMISTYNAPPEFLAATLRSVLEQDPGPDVMQIAVVDDASPRGAPEALVRELGGDRVTVQRQPKNLGMAGIWNRCIELARGRWVHLLHQDDLVAPGFYEKLKAGTESPAAPGLMYCRHAFIDAQGRQLGLSDLDAASSGCVPDPLPNMARKQLIQTPSVVVRRATYEALGGFRPDLCYTLDWEMWCRIAKDFPVWFEPAVLASYRVHGSAATSRLRSSGEDIADLKKCIRINTDYIADEKTRAEVRRFARRRYALMATSYAEDLLAAGNPAAAWRQLRGAWECDKSFAVLKQFMRLSPAWLRGARKPQPR
jgi:glycosyltransferase involved in cell wall biosynthesis